MAHLLGYARISTGEQHPDLQVDALKAAGCYRVFVDTASGALAARPALDQLLDQLRPGDTLVVTLLYTSSRGGRMLVDLGRVPWSGGIEGVVVNLSDGAGAGR